MARFQASLRTLAAGPASFEQLVRALNRQVCAYSLNGRRFTTAFLAELHPRERRLEYASAGHPPAVLVRRDGLEKLDRGGLPFGVDAQARYETGTAQLEAMDLLVVYTDGVCDATNTHGDDFGEQRLLQGLSAMREDGAESARETLVRRVDSFVGSARQVDDMTWLLARALPS
jgi:sigma-B regulation protein RsbU (phosphoserine phosphatase)